MKEFLKKLLAMTLAVTAVLAMAPNTSAIEIGGSRFVLQLNNTRAEKNGALLKLEAPGAPLEENGQVLVPAEWLSKLFGVQTQETETGVTVTNVWNHWNSAEVPKFKENGVLCIPIQQTAQAMGWQLTRTEEKDGGFLFLTESPVPWNVTDSDKSAALKLLGPSRSQLTKGALLLRAGSDSAWADGKQIVLGKAPYTEGDSLLLPAAECAKALNSVASAGTGYTAAQTLAANLGLQYTRLGSSAVLCSFALTGYPDQLAYVQTLCAQLPDKKAEEKPAATPQTAKTELPKAKAYVALTFDDGPTGNGSQGLTSRLLDGLKERGAHATFFMCGYRIKDFHSHMARYLAEGHELGNHTMDHKNLTRLSAADIRSQVDGNSALIAQYTGQKPTVMRPVGGAYNSTLQAEMKKLGLPLIEWSLDTLDWKYRNTVHVKNAIVSNTRDGDIILLHDMYESSVQGALQAVDELKKQGYAFVTVSELAQLKGVDLEAGKVYTGFRK